MFFRLLNDPTNILSVFLEGEGTIWIQLRLNRISPSSKLVQVYFWEWSRLVCQIAGLGDSNL